ncbi:MAG: UDP-N-acetylglucosamine 2-epimerase (non-hydrolyzing) [Ruthenibacterium sp.]
MKIVTVVGARPQFIKAAVVSHALRKNHTEILVHTGQHFDYNMSQQFFEELDIPKPEYNLGISGGTHAEMTARMLIAIEDVLQKEKPDMLLLYGDTNSTLAAALAAAKLHIPICHVEAGTRTNSMTNPEEINRICTDHISSLLLTSTESGLENLQKENLRHRAAFVGDPMLDAFLCYSQKAEKQHHTLQKLDGSVCEIPTQFYYLTCHREENTNTDETLEEILKAMEALDAPVIYPVHPRNKARVKRIAAKIACNNIVFTEPVGYLTSIYLVNHAQKIITDSGGLQREAFFAQKACVTVLNFVCWPETMHNNRNLLASPREKDILDKLHQTQTLDANDSPFGDGNASEKIVKAMEVFCKEKK